jgi:hypothetical protein
MTRPPAPSHIFLQPDDEEKAAILRAQIQDVTDTAGQVEIFHFGLAQFLLVTPDEAFGLCFGGEASLEDICQRGQPPNDLLTVRVPKRYRLDILEMEHWGWARDGSELDGQAG